MLPLDRVSHTRTHLLQCHSQCDSHTMVVSSLRTSSFGVDYQTLRVILDRISVALGVNVDDKITGR